MWLMGISLSGQSGLLITAALLGFVLGAVYDVFRVFRVATRCGRFAVFILDIIYWLICASATFAFILLQNEGKLRILVILSEIAGALLYYYTIGTIVIKKAAVASDMVKRRVRAATTALVRPVRRFGSAAGYKISKKRRTVGSFIKKESKLFKIRLKVHRNMMYNLIQPTNKAKTAGK
jgi:spore cortex biosynthesis protein YabQ